MIIPPFGPLRQRLRGEQREVGEGFQNAIFYLMPHAREGRPRTMKMVFDLGSYPMLYALCAMLFSN